MKRYNFFAMCGILSVLIVAAVGIYPANADIIGSCEADYNKSSQKVHAEITLTGGEEGARASEYPRDFVILMDMSLSTRDVYKGKARLEWVKNATIDFLESLYAYKSRVGIVAFSDDAAEVCQLTFNFEEVKEGIENVSSHGFSTNYGDGIQKATLLLKRREREALPTIIILTDGGEDKGAISVEDAVDFAMKKGIMIYVVSFGQKENVDEVMLREKVAKRTGGEYRYTNFEGLGDTLIETTKMEEFLSAVNLRIVISQSEDAVLDYYSIPSRPLSTSGVIVTAENNRSFTSPKLSRNEEIVVEFDAFSAKKGNITAGIVEVYYTNKEGIKDNLLIPAIYTVKVPGKPFLERYGRVFFILMLVFGILIVLFWIRNYNLRKEQDENIKRVENYINAYKGIKIDDSIVEEIKKKMSR